MTKLESFCLALIASLFIIGIVAQFYIFFVKDIPY